MIENIINNGESLAVIIYCSYKDEGITFLTPDESSQQLGYMNRPKGYVIKPHVHNVVNRTVSLTQEVLFIKSGKVRVDFYTGAKGYLESRVLGEKDVVLLAGGGHGLEMLEPSEIIEVKQGPYVGEMDKVRFEPVATEKLDIKVGRKT